MFFANDLKHVSSTAKLLSIKLYYMSKTGYRQVHNIQAKLFYSEIKFQIIEFSALHRQILRIEDIKYIHNFGMKNMHQF